MASGQNSTVLHRPSRKVGRGLEDSRDRFRLILCAGKPGFARGALSVVGFAAERDRMYVGFAMIVLLILLGSLFAST